jgi:hypothetical protein
MPTKSGVPVSNLVRVARDGSAIIIKTDDGQYVRTSADGSGERQSAATISALTASGSWRRVTSADRSEYAEAAVLAAGKVFVEGESDRPNLFRVPPTVQKSIRSALETYGPVLSDDDREIARRLGSQNQVERSDIEWMHRFFENIEKALALHGGRRGQSWAKKILSEEPVTAGAGCTHPAFMDEEDLLFVAGTDGLEYDEDELDLELEDDDLIDTPFDTLYAVDPADGSVYLWQDGEFTPLDLKDGEIERRKLVEVDPETAELFAAAIDSGKATPLADLFPEERNLFALAESEIDWDFIDVITAAGWGHMSRAERRANAAKQLRDRKGRWIEMGGLVRFRKGLKTQTGEVIGRSGNTVSVRHSDGSGVSRDVSARSIEVIDRVATLPTAQDSVDDSDGYYSDVNEPELPWEEERQTDAWNFVEADEDNPRAYYVNEDTGEMRDPDTGKTLPAAKKPVGLPAVPAQSASDDDGYYSDVNEPELPWEEERQTDAWTVVEADEDNPTAYARNEDTGEKRDYETGEPIDEDDDSFSAKAVIADATGYSPVERSVNAQRQPRGAGGKFGGGSPAPVGQELKAFAKAKLPEGLPLVTDPKKLIEDYLKRAGAQPASVTAAGEPVVEPLYLAVVDAVDKTAVLDVMSITPDQNGQAAAFRREAGEWVAAPDLLLDVQGDTPPPLVELNDEALIKSVLQQVDESDGQSVPDEGPSQTEVVTAAAYSDDERGKLAKKGYALPDGSFPIKNVSDLENAVQAYGRAKDKTAARKHIRKRARALNRTDLVPDDWKNLSAEEPVVAGELFGEYGEVLVAAGIPGVADTPEDFRNVERLKRYWTTGPGGAKIRWGTKGDLTRAHRYLSKYVGSKRAWGLAQNLHKRIFGMTNAERDKMMGH